MTKSAKSKGTSSLRIASKSRFTVLASLIVVGLAITALLINRNSTQTSLATSNNTPSSNSSDIISPKPSIIDGYLTYSNKETGLSFSYPDDWKIGYPGELTEGIFIVQLVSSDYVKQDGTEIQQQGGVFNIHANKSEYKNTQDFKERYTGVGMYNAQTMRDTTVAGYPALTRNDCEGSQVCVFFVRDNVYYDFSYIFAKAETSTDGKYLQVFSDLVKSAKFN